MQRNGQMKPLCFNSKAFYFEGEEEERKQPTKAEVFAQMQEGPPVQDAALTAQTRTPTLPSTQQHCLPNEMHKEQ